jgi:hypothetical protein
MKKVAIICGIIILVALGLRITGVDMPYHQDEYKWALIVAEGSPLKGGITHPPLDELTYVFADRVFGNEHLRVLPVIFFFLDALLLLYFAYKRYSKRIAVWAVALYGLCFYSVLASLMVDTDGQVLPFLFLVLLIAHFKWYEEPEHKKDAKKKKIVWGAVFLAAVTVGLLIKLSFILCVAAIIADVIISERKRINKSTVLTGALVCLGIAAIGLGAVYISSFFGFDISHATRYWANFFDISDRNFLQIVVQCAKVAMYLSPLLLFPILLVDKEAFKETRTHFFFLLFGIIFYLVLFDFSTAALDRYFQFAIIPLSIIGAVTLSKIKFEKFMGLSATLKDIAIAIGVALLSFNLISHAVPPLYPKTEWIHRMLLLEWDFLYPFTGGSGPLGFYVSFLFIALCFIISFACIMCMRKHSNTCALWSAGVFLMVGVIYNGVFTEEYLFGTFNGSSQRVMEPAIAYIRENQDIKEVINYNDIGTYELRAMDKHKQRLYVAPQFSDSATEAINTFKGHYLVIDVPHIDENSIFGKHFATCEVAFEEISEEIKGTVYGCSR